MGPRPPSRPLLTNAFDTRSELANARGGYSKLARSWLETSKTRRIYSKLTRNLCHLIIRSWLEADSTTSGKYHPNSPKTGGIHSKLARRKHSLKQALRSLTADILYCSFVAKQWKPVGQQNNATNTLRSYLPFPRSSAALTLLVYLVGQIRTTKTSWKAGRGSAAEHACQNWS